MYMSYKDFDRYLKDYPNKDGFFGTFGGQLFRMNLFLHSEKSTMLTKQSATAPSLSTSSAESEKNSREERPRSIIAKDFRITLENARFTLKGKTLTTPVPIS